MHFFHPLLALLPVFLVELLILMAVIANLQFYPYLPIPDHLFDLGLHVIKSTSSAFVARKEWITSSARPGVAVGVAFEEEVDVWKKMMSLDTIHATGRDSKFVDLHLHLTLRHQGHPTVIVVFENYHTLSPMFPLDEIVNALQTVVLIKQLFAIFFEFALPLKPCLDGCPDLLESSMP
ncbi:hypothetical protein Tco_0196153 [Tanacetum coccineum]